ncbi:glycoside hydrolase family 19 protein [Sinosporangium siamense]|uniref:Chitinase n=1 Tax=Sinosporangium siamense TaxID=1367973 RepID=A0A919V8L8_9ACTN|nr:glycoside hydrolase family 19 protein [Sinosporangium siamense]GII96270.1 chitinase [Sinosporangium siamense]
MLRKRIKASMAALAAAATVAVAVPLTIAATASAAVECAPAWSASAVYTGGNVASHGGKNWRAKWWTQNETPGGNSGVWDDQGACGGGGTPTPTPTPNPTCPYAPDWAAGTSYAAGAVVTYRPNGKQYRAVHANPGYDPTISTYFWQPYVCDDNPQPTPTPSPSPTSTNPGDRYVITEAQFNQMFPNRNTFYTYRGLTDALSAYPAFAGTGSETVRKQEFAAFLANINHETGGLVHIVEQNTANYPHYCDRTQPYGCPAGQAAYYGRGPIQLSWNFNYKAAGDALGINLLGDPFLVERDPAVAWKTALWYWNTQNGPGTMTAHAAMVNGRGFGETIRSINGALECNGGNPAQVQSRINSYQRFTSLIGTTPGNNLTC